MKVKDNQGGLCFTMWFIHGFKSIYPPQVGCVCVWGGLGADFSECL